MTEEEIRNRYFEWICGRIGGDGFDPSSYSELLRHLDGIDYIYTFPRDGNRFDDGISLRYRFGKECEIEPAVISSMLDVKPCSILEMMTALAVRCEEDVTYDPKIGDRTGVWFWVMLNSLGLLGMNNGYIDNEKVDAVILTFLQHRYAENGKGSLFHIYGKSPDVRNMELWDQMGAFLAVSDYI